LPSPVTVKGKIYSAYLHFGPVALSQPHEVAAGPVGIGILPITM